MHILENASNYLLISFGDGVVALYSYKTLVAVRRGGKKYRTAVFYSNTTSRHINKNGFRDAEKIPQEELEALVNH